MKRRALTLVQALAAAVAMRCASTPAASPPPCAGFLPPVRLVTGLAPLPDSYLAARLAGEVVDEVLIRHDGTVGPIRLVHTRISTLAPFAEASLRRSRFAPASIEGNPVATRVLVSTAFGDTRKVKNDPAFDSLWVHVPGGVSREARWQLAGSVDRLTLVAHVGSALAQGGEIVVRAPDGGERTLWKLAPAAGPPGELRETVKAGDVFARAGDYRLELRAPGKILAFTTFTVAPDFKSAVVNACAPL